MSGSATGMCCMVNDQENTWQVAATKVNDVPALWRRRVN